MISKAHELMPNIEKLERLLGHNLGINELILEERVKDSIKKHIASLNLILIPFDAAKVNLKQIIL